MSGLKLRGVRKSFGAVEVIKGVDLDIDDKEFVVFVGPSGCGKSTLLRMIAGLETITGGDIDIGDQRVNDLDPSKRGIAMVFQSYALYPHMTVRENMGFALRFAGVPKPEIDKQVDEAARILELGPLMNRRPKELSGGQRQRVAIGRAIVRHPQVFLFDEPLSNLDAELRVHMRIEIARLHKELATTIIYVTHDQVEAMTLADKIVVLRDGVDRAGRHPARALRRSGQSVRRRLHRLAQDELPPGRRRRRRASACRDYGNQTIPLTAQGAPADGTAVTVGIRPEHFKAGGAAHLDLNVEMIEHLGSETYAYARSGDGDLLTIATQNDRDAQGRRQPCRPASTRPRRCCSIAAGQRIR